jgi:hypothetical protein
MPALIRFLAVLAAGAGGAVLGFGATGWWLGRHGYAHGEASMAASYAAVFIGAPAGAILGLIVGFAATALLTRRRT